MLEPRYTRQFESEILNLVDHQQELTRSDLQGLVTVVNRIIEEGHRLLSKLESESR